MEESMKRWDWLPNHTLPRENEKRKWEMEREKVRDGERKWELFNLILSKYMVANHEDEFDEMKEEAGRLFFLPSLPHFPKRESFKSRKGKAGMEDLIRLETNCDIIRRQFTCSRSESGMMMRSNLVLTSSPLWEEREIKRWERRMRKRKLS